MFIEALILGMNKQKKHSEKLTSLMEQCSKKSFEIRADSLEDLTDEEIAIFQDFLKSRELKCAILRK